VLIHRAVLKTLDRANLLSGYAEMLKHALIDRQETLEQLLAIDPSDLSVEKLADFVAESVMVKDHYVENDPLEKNIRKALNLGHTIGHAYESLAMKKGRPALHGYAVAWGIIAELKLAVEKQGFPGDVQEGVEKYIHSIYGGHGFSESDFDSLYDLMKHDKKNCGERINFTLLNKVGEVVIDVDCGKEVVRSVIG
jgi:3-dehydroquinate synthase